MLTLVAYIACITVLVGVLYLGFVFVYDLVLRVIGRLPTPTQDRLLGTAPEKAQRR